MNNSRRHSPWSWIPGLSVAEEIPFVIVTYVAVLMFVQFREGYGMSAFYASMLSIPWVLKSFVRSKVRSSGFFKMRLHISECLIFILLIMMEVCINYAHHKNFLLFLVLFIISGLCAWHELLSKMYYERMLYPREQLLFNGTKIFAKQTTTVLTYGVLIIVVGFLEIFFRSISKAWAMESYLIAGVFFVFTVLNVFTLQNPHIVNTYHYESMAHTVKTELHIIERIRRQTGSRRVILALFFLLLPQSLMFHSRVFFLLAPAGIGGLECTVQEVGFAQGTIGVLAFSFGLIIGRKLLHLYRSRMFWPMTLSLLISPVCYLLMSQQPMRDDMLMLCLMTFSAQITFGFGLNVCLYFVKFISHERYRNTINYLYIPLIAASMFLPMMLSGWMCEWLGFRTFFIIDSASALIALILIPTLSIKQILTNEKNK